MPCFIRSAMNRPNSRSRVTEAARAAGVMSARSTANRCARAAPENFAICRAAKMEPQMR